MLNRFSHTSTTHAWIHFYKNCFVNTGFERNEINCIISSTIISSTFISSAFRLLFSVFTKWAYSGEVFDVGVDVLLSYSKEQFREQRSSLDTSLALNRVDIEKLSKEELKRIASPRSWIRWSRDGDFETASVMTKLLTIQFTFLAGSGETPTSRLSNRYRSTLIDK